ncbi:biotin--[acetyl-CoA-carboxylase] ligase [Pontiellaceae bacterium B12227]|nr:biotin--[acetyl-CoA-carboxylase] ligase [Pontiellaceae bacterium B12227]
MTFEVEWHDRLGSTNAYMKEHFNRELKISNGTIFATREQTAGRGRADRKWLTAPDTNLCFSLFIETSCTLMEVPSLTMAAALAINEYLNAQLIPASPKWPNDVLVDGKKICGILSERVERKTFPKAGIIVGIGLNVNMSSEEADAIDRPATSMLIESNRAGDLFQTLENLFQPLEHWIGKWQNGGFSNLRKSWTEKAGPIGKPLTVHDGPIKKSGTLAGFGDHGELLLQTESGLETIWSGDVS